MLRIVLITISLNRIQSYSNVGSSATGHGRTFTVSTVDRNHLLFRLRTPSGHAGAQEQQARYPLSGEGCPTGRCWFGGSFLGSEACPGALQQQTEYRRPITPPNKPKAQFAGAEDRLQRVCSGPHVRQTGGTVISRSRTPHGLAVPDANIDYAVTYDAKRSQGGSDGGSCCV